MAVRVGFEPTERLHVRRFSRPELSTTQQTSQFFYSPNKQAKQLNNYLDSKIRYLFLQETKRPNINLNYLSKKNVVVLQCFKISIRHIDDELKMKCHI